MCGKLLVKTINFPQKWPNSAMLSSKADRPAVSRNVAFLVAHLLRLRNFYFNKKEHLAISCLLLFLALLHLPVIAPNLAAFQESKGANILNSSSSRKTLQVAAIIHKVLLIHTQERNLH